MKKLFTSFLGWIVISLVGAVIFGILANNHEWAKTPMIICWILPLTTGVAMIINAWIIIPIKSLINKKKS